MEAIQNTQSTEQENRDFAYASGASDAKRGYPSRAVAFKAEYRFYYEQGVRDTAAVKPIRNSEVIFVHDGPAHPFYGMKATVLSSWRTQPNVGEGISVVTIKFNDTGREMNVLPSHIAPTQ